MGICTAKLVIDYDTVYTNNSAQFDFFSAQGVPIDLICFALSIEQGILRNKFRIPGI